MLNLHTISPILEEHATCLLGYSGGVDSHVLLHLLVAWRNQKPGRTIRALHVHHGLHAEADKMAAHCLHVCQQLSVPCDIEKITVSIGNEGIESAARTGRYAALRYHAKKEYSILTAHNQEDQAETVLLQLLRGAGPKGLSAMPERQCVSGIWHVRPLLHSARESITQYAHAHNLQWQEDPTNRLTLFDRNYLRQVVFPVLHARWPAVAKTFSRSAEHCAENIVLQDCFVSELFSQCIEKGAIKCSSVAALKPAARKNVLRMWLAQKGCVLSTAQLENFERTVVFSSKDANPVLILKENTVRRYRDKIYCLPTDPKDMLPVLQQYCVTWDLKQTLILPFSLGYLTPNAFPGYTELTVRFRRKGEHINILTTRHRVALKKFLQQLNVPPWERGKVALVFSGEVLLAILGYYPKNI